MANVAVATRTILGTPGIEQVDGQVFLNLHIMNVGEFSLERLHITGVSLDSALRTSPVAFPVVLDRIGAGSVGHLTARFASGALAAGRKYLLAVSGHYTVRGTAYGLNLNRYVQIPVTALAAQARFQARLASSLSTNYWNFLLLNDEPAGSPHHIASFSLSIAAPVDVTATPPGWAVQTDSHSYVLWYAQDVAPPYPHHVGPRQSLSGFQLMGTGTQSEATPAALTSWNHATDSAGLVSADYVMTPYRFA